MKNRKILIICSVILVLGSSIILVIIFVSKTNTNNDLIENYVYKKYGLELIVDSENTVYRGDIGFNPGRSYYFKMHSKEGKKYDVEITSFEDETLEEMIEAKRQIYVNEIDVNRKNDYINMNYEIISNTNWVKWNKSKNNRGYEVVEQNSEYYLIIYYGEMPVYYSSLDVLNVEIKGQDVKVYVKLLENEGIGDAFS